MMAVTETRDPKSQMARKDETLSSLDRIAGNSPANPIEEFPDL